PQSGITDANGDFKSIFNSPTIVTETVCRVTAEASKSEYNDRSGYVDVTLIPIPWPTFSHDCRRTGLSPYDTSSNPGKLKWSFTTGGFVMSPVIGSDGTIYVGSHDNKMYAINPDGTEKWNFTIGGYMALSPAIDSDGTIYAVANWDGLFAINPDGTEKWHAIPGGHMSYSPAIGADGTIYVPVRDYNLYAINSDGTVKWIFTTSNGHVGSPAIDYDGTIYIGSNDHKLYAINPDGTEKWNTTSGDMIQAAPAIGLDGTIYVGSKDNNLYAVSPSGIEKWRFTAGGAICWQSSPGIANDGTIYVGSNDHNLYAINPNGIEEWRFSANSQIQSAPAIGADGTIYFGSDDFNLYAINPDGSKKWIFTTGWNIHSSPAIGTDGTIYIGSMDGKLYAIGEGGLPPTADTGSDQTVNEGSPLQLDASASYDPDGTIESYEWDFDASDGLWWETGAVPDATGPTSTHTYGDDGEFIVTLRVIDNDNLSATDTCNVIVQNVDPTVTIESITMEVKIGLRVAGRKYNNVSIVLYEDGNLIGYVSIERMPGSPDEQMAWIPVSINFSKSYDATVTYTPKDPPNVGANPVWIYLKSKDGSIKKIHHTFNVQQSKKRDSEHWNHVEPWEVELNAHFIGLPFEIISYITDPGSDDETLTFTYGSQVKTVTYLNNPTNPDPYPSPEINPVDIIDTTTLIYEGAGTVIVVVKDDDNIRLGVGEGTDYLSVG
ncbi:MAG: PQQ-binding-like beta-propeller repeat protein, partial [Candidatus Hodarchaeota archaeon]